MEKGGERPQTLQSSSLDTEPWAPDLNLKPTPSTVATQESGKLQSGRQSLCRFQQGLWCLRRLLI